MEVRFKNYVLKKKIGSGSFGDVWLGINDETNDKVAIKQEPYDKSNPNKNVYFETKILENLRGQFGFPKQYECGIEDEFYVMASQLLGPSLDDLVKFCGGKFSLKTTQLLAVQMLDRIETFHSIDFIHRDIKPENFCVGLDQNKDTIYLIDFGLAKRYSDPRTGLHIRYQENKGLTGTARYVSISSHLGIEQSRRDDLESIGYVLMYFLRGNLPWEKLESQTKLDKFRKIMETKINTPIDELCRGYPDEFQTYLEYCRNLRFEEKPDYNWVKNLFKNLYFKHEDNWNNVFDWSYIKNTKLIIEEK